MKAPKRPSFGGGKPHENSQVFETSESLMDAQARLIDLLTLAAELQEYLRKTQRLLLAQGQTQAA